jgi:hypothetical protein
MRTITKPRNAAAPLLAAVDRPGTRRRSSSPVIAANVAKLPELLQSEEG